MFTAIACYALSLFCGKNNTATSSTKIGNAHKLFALSSSFIASILTTILKSENSLTAANKRQTNASNERTRWMKQLQPERNFQIDNSLFCQHRLSVAWGEKHSVKVLQQVYVGCTIGSPWWMALQRLHGVDNDENEAKTKPKLKWKPKTKTNHHLFFCFVSLHIILFTFHLRHLHPVHLLFSSFRPNYFDLFRFVFLFPQRKMEVNSRFTFVTTNAKTYLISRHTVGNRERRKLPKTQPCANMIFQPTIYMVLR